MVGDSWSAGAHPPGLQHNSEQPGEDQHLDALTGWGRLEAPPNSISCLSVNYAFLFLDDKFQCFQQGYMANSNSQGGHYVFLGESQDAQVSLSWHMYIQLSWLISDHVVQVRNMYPRGAVLGILRCRDTVSLPASILWEEPQAHSCPALPCKITTGT